MKIVRHNNYCSIEELEKVKVRKKIAFFPSNDTIMHSFLAIIKAILKDTAPKITVFLPKRDKENAASALSILNQNDISVLKAGWYNLLRNKPDILILGNDWANESKYIMLICRLLNIPTICIQESVIDFQGNQFRMQWADNVILQGVSTLKLLNRKECFIAGNPRYENLEITNLPDIHNVLINCNFTYGIFEEVRETWLNDITDELKLSGINYFISQHPRDTGEIKKYGKVINSSAASIHDQIIQSSIIITRFSSIVHEAIAMGIFVIYYNPHGESMYYDFEYNHDFLFYAINKTELKNCISKCLNKQFPQLLALNYLRKHIRPFKAKPSSVIANIITNEEISTRNGRSINFLWVFSVYYMPDFLKTFLKRLKVYFKYFTVH